MADVLTPVAFGAILCADWSNEASGRAVYVALPGTRVIQRVNRSSWTFDQLVDDSYRYPDLGPVVIAVDAPIGVPRSLAPDRHEAPEFTRWLRAAVEHPEFFLPCMELDDWSPHRPFFPVQGGPGGFTRWVERMKAHGVKPRREIEKWTGANPVFVVNGIPGAVGHAARDIWKGLLKNRRNISVWPFDGLLHELADPARPTLGEIYPRAMYGIALGEQPVDQRCRLAISKNDQRCRNAALRALGKQRWVQDFGVVISDTEPALKSGDDFDALMSAAALMRCVLDGTPLESTYRHSIEGGMLGSLSLNIHLRERRFVCRPADEQRARSRTAGPRPLKSLKAFLRVCPIPDCSHIFESGRGGWDAHVASLRMHPNWRHDVPASEERKRLFKLEFPEFFEG